MAPSLGAVRTTFALFGMFWGTWAVAAADIEQAQHLSAGRLGLVLSASIGAGGLLSACAGGLAERVGPTRMLRVTLVAWGACALGASVGHGALFLAIFVLALVSGGLVDMAMNAAGAMVVGDQPARMVRLHALFNTGALLGAAVTGALLHAGLSWRWSWSVVGVGAMALSAGWSLVFATTRRSARATPATPIGASIGVLSVSTSVPGAPSHVTTSSIGPAHGAPSAGTDSEGHPPRTTVVASATASPAPPSASARSAGASPVRATLLRSFSLIRARHLTVLALCFAAAAAVEGGIDTWGVLYLRTVLAAGVLLGAGAYCLGQAIAVATRGAGGGVVGRLGPRWGLVLGTGLAAGGLALEAGSHRAPAAAGGLVLAAGGISLCWPLVMSAAWRVAADAGEQSSAPALVGALTAMGYIGWVVAPAVVGWMANELGLGAGLALLAGVAGVAAVTLALIPVPSRSR